MRFALPTVAGLVVVGLLPSAADANAGTVIETLMRQAQGSRTEAYSAVAHLSECSGFFSAFADQVTGRGLDDQSALEGIATMERDTATVAGLVWSQHDPRPLRTVNPLVAEARTASGASMATIGIDGPHFVHRYDVCSQAFLFSQFFLGTAQEAAPTVR